MSGRLGRRSALERRKLELQGSIEAEARRPWPCSLTLQRLKRQRLVLKDDLARLRRPAA